MATIENGTLYKNYSELSVHEKINVRAYYERCDEQKYKCRAEIYLTSYQANRSYPDFLYGDMVDRFPLLISGKMQRFSKSKLITI